MARLVVPEEHRAGDTAGLLNPLAEGVVDRAFRGAALAQGLETSRVVVDCRDGGITGGVAGSIVAVGAGQGAGDPGNSVVRRGDRVRGGGRAGLGQAVAIGIVGPAPGEGGAEAAG